MWSTNLHEKICRWGGKEKEPVELTGGGGGGLGVKLGVAVKWGLNWGGGGVGGV